MQVQVLGVYFIEDIAVWYSAHLSENLICRYAES